MENVPLTSVQNTFKDERKRQIFLIVVGVMIGILITYGYTYFKYSGLISREKAINNSNIAGYNQEINTLRERIKSFEERTSTKEYGLLSTCNGEQCLFKGPEAVEGFAKFNGYYITSEKKGANNLTLICDGFLIESGNPILREHFIDLITRGNTVNTVDAKGNLIITINTQELSPQDQAVLKSSTNARMVEISLVRKTPEGRSANDCESIVNIVDVNSQQISN